MPYPTVLFDVSSLTPEIINPRGAQLGRDEWGVVDVDADECFYAATQVILYGDYDKGAVYWGNNGRTLYCVHTVASDDFRKFDRFDSADAAFDAFEIPSHLRVTVEQPPLTFDCSELGEMDVTAILELFDTDQLYTSQVAGSRDGCHEAFAKARSVVKDWVFSPELYKAIGKWWAGMGGDDDDGFITEQDLRAIVLQEMAHLYVELESTYSDLGEDDDDFDNPLEMLRRVNWTDECECPVDLSVCGNKIYYCFSG